MDLTPREREVARLIATGHSSKQIAADLGISFRTVVCHRFRIFKKMGVTNTAELVGAAVRMGLIDFFSDANATNGSGESLFERVCDIGAENTRERQILAALLSESRRLRAEAVNGRKDFIQVRRQMFEQVKELMECLNDKSGSNIQTAPDVRDDSSGLHPGSPEHVHAAGKNGSVSAAS